MNSSKELDSYKGMTQGTQLRYNFGQYKFYCEFVEIAKLKTTNNAYFLVRLID